MKKPRPIPPDLAAAAARLRRVSLKPHEIPLELAIEVCRLHGFVFYGKRSNARRRWRIGFLKDFRKSKALRKTMELHGLSPSTVYRERENEPLFDHAVRMILEEVPWSEEAWHRALEAALVKEGPAKAAEDIGDQKDPSSVRPSEKNRST